MIVALAGGVGAAKLLAGLTQVVAPDRLTAIVNTGDDAEFHGLHVSPDLDIVTYTLAGIVHERGWGIAGDTFNCLAALSKLGAETWFQLGDADLAMHIRRTEMLRQGLTLSEATERLTEAMGVRTRLLPMSDQRVATRVATPAGLVDFQEYMVRRAAQDDVSGIELDGIDRAEPAPGVLEALRDADGIIICPSNPIISIGPIMALPGVRDVLRAAAAPVVAVSPIVGGRALKGPSDRMLIGLGHEPSSYGVAQLYRDFVDVLVIDSLDEALSNRIADLGLKVVVTNTIMATPEDKKALAATMVGEIERHRYESHAQTPGGSL